MCKLCQLCKTPYIYMYMQLKTLLTIVQHEPEVIGCLLLTNTLKTFISFYFEFYVSQIQSEMRNFFKFVL